MTSLPRRARSPERSAVNTGYAVLLIAAALWNAAIVFPPLAHGVLHADGLAVLSRTAFSPVCHQDPARSFRLWSFPFGVCGRCTAIYAAGLAGIAAWPLVARRLRAMRLHPWLFLTALAPLALDVALDVSGILANTMLSRTLTGGLTGLILGLFAAEGAAIAWSECRIDRLKSTYPEDLGV